MDKACQEKWNARYADATLSTPAEPCHALRQHTRLLPLQGKALDLACGLGGNARHLAQCGLQVSAWDISERALTVLAQWAQWASAFRRPIATRQVDLAGPWPEETFDVIVVSHYLDRQRWRDLQARVNPGGLIFFQTFLAPVQTRGPRNPDYYLRSGELNRVFSNWRILVHGEGWPNGHRQAWSIARKPRPA